MREFLRRRSFLDNLLRQLDRIYIFELDLRLSMFLRTFIMLVQRNKGAAFLPTQARGYTDTLSYGSISGDIVEENEQWNACERTNGEDGGESSSNHELSTYAEHEKPGIVKHVLTMCLTKPVSPLLLALPFAYISYHQEWSPVWVFWLNFLGMVPVRSWIGTVLFLFYFYSCIAIVS